MHQAISQDDDTPMLTIGTLLHEGRLRAAAHRQAFLEMEAELTRRLLALRVLGSVSRMLFMTTDGKQIDSRECAPFDPADADWGEQDSLANVPFAVWDRDKRADYLSTGKY